MATLFAFGFGLLVTGGVFIERIFGWYGMGDWLIVGVQTQDVNIVATVTLFVAVLVLASGCAVRHAVRRARSTGRVR